MYNQRRQRVKKLLLLLPIFGLLFASCSQFSNSITSRSWHNVNARYNALWIAKANYEFVTDTLFQTRKEDYTKVLPVLLPVDTVRNAFVKNELEEVIKKASLVAERHSNSKYLDEAYNLLGKARILKGDFLNAAEVFKYVNSNGTIPREKHAALIMLMRTYIENDDLKTANDVSEVIKALPLKGSNVADYYIMKAYYHQKNDEPLLAAAILDEALKTVKKSERKGRLYYIVGQIYEENGRPDLAVKRYALVDRNKPNYDLAFNAQVNALSARAGASGGQGTALSSFAKMLNDRKNNDLKDKIYLKMGNIEAERKNYGQAFDYFNKSVINSRTKEGKSAAYLATANLYYDKTGNYEKAAMYYDSTLFNMEQTNLEFKTIANKANSLTSFIKYRKVIALEDSLQTLARMNPVALDKKIDEIVKKQDVEKNEMIQLAQNTIGNQDAAPSSTVLQNRWELYDPVQISNGKSAFIQKWGSRPLADNWRRRDQQAGAVSIKLERLTEADLQREATQKAEAKLAENNLESEQIVQRKRKILEAIPTTPEKLVASQRNQEEALFQLGKIYKLQFNEIANARTTFKELLAKYPDSYHTPEVLYFLAIMSENPSANEYRTSLLTNYSASSFAKQLERGQVEITTGMENQAQQFYKNLYETYAAGNTTAALNLANNGLNQYAGTSIEDKIAFLRIYILAKGSDLPAYQQSIDDFIIGFPASSLLGRVKSMQATIAKKE